MDNEIIGKILEKTGQNELLDILTKKISFSELNSLLLEVFRIKAEEITPTESLKMYSANRFVKPANENPVELLELELEILKISEAFSFTPIMLSPVAPLGACSSVATANQNKVISALRGTEVLADATNSLALHICSLKKNKEYKTAAGEDNKMRYCTLHRHVRAQFYNNPRSLPHFELFCMVTSGRDSGSYSFEKESLLEHFNVYRAIFKRSIYFDDLKFKLIKVGGYPDSDGFFERMAEHVQDKLNGVISLDETPLRPGNQYYRGLQFKIYVHFEGRDFELADGGFVDWSQKFLENKKERMLISGMGLGLPLKLMKS